MDFRALLDKVRHLDRYLDQLTVTYGTTTYAILAVIVFCETGLVVTPFLPGDSLLFAVGAVGMRDGSGLNPFVAGPILIAAALLGDNVNYHVGKALGHRVMKGEKSRIFNRRGLEKTERFFEKYGGKTIVLARFVPIVRTFAPFVAGAGTMRYSRFLMFSIVGAVLWVTTMMGAGMVFGQMQVVKNNFELVVIGIVLLSVLPMVIEYLRSRGKPAEAAP